MPQRQLPVRPDLDQLRHQARDLVYAMRRGDPPALADLFEYHPGFGAAAPDGPARGPRDRTGEPAAARLADAQLVLARSYDVGSWPRLVHACRLIDAIWRDDVAAVRALVMQQPRLIHENASGTKQSNWGPPMTYAANLGRDAVIDALHELGAKDHASAFDRATLQGQVRTARKLYAMMGNRPAPLAGLVGPAEALSASGTALMFELGARVHDAGGRLVAPVDLVLQTYSRNPAGKHEILELYARHGLELPDTPVMAFHRGRIDLLEEHLHRDPDLLRRTFPLVEIYPPVLGCHHETSAMHGTPLAGATLLHLSVEFDEMEIARWLLDRGMHVDARAAIDADGFGGHTALFGCVISYPNFIGNRSRLLDAPFARLLLDHGADPNARASLRKRLDAGPDRGPHEYRDVTPLSWGQRFRDRSFVSASAMELIAARGGTT